MAFAVSSLGSVLHFAWDWSGRNAIVAFFAATNESTWEHLKMAFWPAVLTTPIHVRLAGRPPNWLEATAIRWLVPPILIPVAFYTYLAFTGSNVLALDIGIFIVAILTGELLAIRVLNFPGTAGSRFLAITVMVVSLVCFATLSYYPLDNLLFEDPLSQSAPGGAK